MRLKRILQVSPFIVILLVGIYFLRFLGNQHRHIDTAGDIIYSSTQSVGGKSHIFIVRTDGTGTKQITFGNADDTQPSFSSDGSQITYISDKSGSPEVYVADADGQGARAITIGNGAKIDPQFAPDGEHVGYIAGGKLLIVDLNSGDSQLVLPSSQDVANSTTAQLSSALRQPVLSFKWSHPSDPSQTVVAAVQEDPDGNLQTVSLVPTGGGKPDVLVGGSSASIDWSPDGTQLAIALIGGQGGSGAQPIVFSGIIMFKSDGTAISQPPLAAVPTANDGPQDPGFAADGSKVAFTVVEQSKVGTLEPRGIAITPATPGGQVQVVVQGAGKLPQFSPDGSSLLFTAPDAKNPSESDVYVFNLSAGKVISVTVGQGDVSSAEWSPSLPSSK